MIPNNYVRVDYIECGENQYIDTGVSGNSCYGIEFEFTTLATHILWGSIISAQLDNFTIGVVGVDITKAYLRHRENEITQSIVLSNTRNKLSIKDNKLICNGTQYGTLSTSSPLATTNQNIFVNTNSDKSRYTTNKVYSLKLYGNDNILIRDLLPVKRNDNVLGFYDQVNDVFYTNQGSGSFTYGHEIPENIILTNNPLEFKVGNDVELQANFKIRYQITINYDSSLGSASYEWGQGSNVILTASPNANAQFLGWYINQTKLSSDLSYEYQVSGDTTFEARFGQVWDITTSVVGSGAIQYTRQSTNKNNIEFSVIPSPNWHFVKYVVDGVEYTTTPLQITISNDINVVAYFEEDEKYHITARTNIPNNSVYISENDVYSGTMITLFARPFPNYNFVNWSDGETANPRTLVVNSNITIVANFAHVIETNGIYQYRCYVKDQLDLTAPPKTFMVVDTFSLREDYLTNATSQISVLNISSNINNGDIIVVYNPRGEVIYNGVITSISDNEITTSQMQSFYKGLWIYNINPQETLEEEIALLLQDFVDGKMYGSTYIDPLVAERLGGITIQSVNTTEVHLPTDLDKDGNEQYTQYDMEEFIYELYRNYGIVFEFEINFDGANYVTIKVPTYTSMKVGNNHYSIQNLSPVQTIEETNRLIIYAKDKTYRTTYVATKQGIVEQPSTLVNRFEITNTKVVFSDDDVEDLIASNLPQQMYNHKITFTLFIKNSIYQYRDFILGMPLEIWQGSDYYASILTGRSLSKESNTNVMYVDYTCGLVRTALTKKLTLKIV